MFVDKIHILKQENLMRSFDENFYQKGEPDEFCPYESGFRNRLTKKGKKVVIPNISKQKLTTRSLMWTILYIFSVYLTVFTDHRTSPNLFAYAKEPQKFL